MASDDKLPDDVLAATRAAADKIFDVFSGALTPTNVGKPLYHYTNLQSAISIVDSQALRATSSFHVNDLTEKSHGYGLIQSVGAKFAWDDTAMRDRVLSNAKAQNLSFIFSMTRAEDLLSQWRAYANDPENPGIALRFVPDALYRTNSAKIKYPDETIGTGATGLYEVIYDNARKEEILNSLFGQINTSASALLKKWPAFSDRITSLLATYSSWIAEHFACCVKLPGFSEEGEWRIVLQMPYVSDRIKFRRSGRLVIPYIELQSIDGPLPIDGVVFGSMMSADNVSQMSFRHLLLNRGYEVHKLHFSNTKLPLRS